MENSLVELIQEIGYSFTTRFDAYLFKIFIYKILLQTKFVNWMILKYFYNELKKKLLFRFIFDDNYFM